MQQLKESADMPLVTPRQWCRVAAAHAVSAALAAVAGQFVQSSQGDGQ